MWYENANGVDAPPAELDMDSSRKYVYLRRKITRVEASGEGEERTEAHYTWEELKVPREMWEIVRAVLEHSRKIEEHTTAFDDVYAALTEVAEIVAGGEE